MTRRRFSIDRRSAIRGAAAVTPGPDCRDRPRYAGSHLELPVILVEALAASGTSADDFLRRLVGGSIWQDEAIHSPGGDVEIQAHLGREGLRCVVRLGSHCWYHHPAKALHVFGMELPATAMTLREVPLASIVAHDLLDPLDIRAVALRELNPSKPDLGICIYLDMPIVCLTLPS